jgi:hypothetical protein
MCQNKNERETYTDTNETYTGTNETYTYANAPT